MLLIIYDKEPLVKTSFQNWDKLSAG